jgi:hypothetical protein
MIAGVETVHPRASQQLRICGVHEADCMRDEIVVMHAERVSVAF